MDGETSAIRPTLTITFDPPLAFGDKSTSEVTLREPTADEYDQASRNTVGFGLARQLMVSVGKLSGPQAALMPLSKMRAADEFFAQFLRPAPPPPPPVPQAPQEGDGAIFAAMQLREPTLAELEAAGVGLIGTARLVHFTAGLPMETALRMPLSVLRRADAFFAGFETPAQTTGNS
jgi:hypothetical protein